MRLICLAALIAALGAPFASSNANAQFAPPRFAPPAKVFAPNANRVAPIESENFVVYAADLQLARKVSREAERYRDELAEAWLGHKLPKWRDKCPIKVTVERHAGGETSFAFIRNQNGGSQPIDWQMKIFGPPDRLLDAVLPHEITHTIFATHFGCPLPRWADEGACTTVEHESERRKNHQMLIEFLSTKPSRGIPFNRMFTMRNYPHDILPLYAQGYSLARFLIMKRGRRQFLDYVSLGLNYEQNMHVLKAWDRATSEVYGFRDLSDLQVAWQGWVEQGCPSDEIAQAQPANTAPLGARSEVVAASFNADENRQAQRGLATFAEVDRGAAIKVASAGETGNSRAGSWYRREMNRGRGNVSTSSDSLEREVKARKVAESFQSDASLPAEFRSPVTIWR